MCHLVHCGGVAEERVWDGKHISSGEVGGDGQVVDSHTHRASSTVHQHTGTAGGGRGSDIHVFFISRWLSLLNNPLAASNIFLHT